MRSEYYILIIILLIVIYIQRRNERVTVSRIISAKRKGKGEKTQMVELAKKFIGKECLIYTFNSQLEGTVREVSDGAILVEKKGVTEAVNLDFVTRIREYPRNKKGKKKSVVLD